VGSFVFRDSLSVKNIVMQATPTGYIHTGEKPVSTGCLNIITCLSTSLVVPRKRNLSNQPWPFYIPENTIHCFSFVILSEVEESSFLSIIFIPMSIGIQHVPHCHCEITEVLEAISGWGILLFSLPPKARKTIVLTK